MVSYGFLSAWMAVHAGKDKRAALLVIGVPIWFFMGAGSLASAWWKSGIISAVGIWELGLSGACYVAMRLIYEEKA